MGAGEGVHGDGAVSLLGGADIWGAVVWGCKKHSLKMLERCSIALSSWAKPLQGGWAGFSSQPQITGTG